MWLQSIGQRRWKYFPYIFTSKKNSRYRQGRKAAKGHLFWFWIIIQAHLRRTKHDKRPSTEHKYDTLVYVPSNKLPFNIQIPYDTNNCKGHHPSCTKPATFFPWVSERSKARLLFANHAFPMQFSQSHQPNKTPLWFIMKGPTSLWTDWVHSLGPDHYLHMG